MSKNILITYYSWSGNTTKIANAIAKETGGKLFEIIPADAYPESYNNVVNQAKQEIKAGYKPELKTDIEKLDDFDIIFIGSPNWWSTIAPPVTTFLTKHNLQGKTVIPFITHGGGGVSRCVKDIAALCANSTTKDALVVSGAGGSNLQKTVTKWLEDISVAK